MGIGYVGWALPLKGMLRSVLRGGGEELKGQIEDRLSRGEGNSYILLCFILATSFDTGPG